MNIKNEYKWKIGYCIANAENMNPLHFSWMKNAAIQCERFILGIPNKEVMEKA